MNPPDVPSTSTPRWSVKRWLVTLAIALMVTVALLAAAPAKLYHDRKGFQERMARQRVGVRFETDSQRVRWLDDHGVSRNVLKVLVGEIHVSIRAIGDGDQGRSDNTLGSSEKVVRVFRSLEDIGRIDRLKLTGDLINDETLRELPTDLKLHTIWLGESSVTEQGLREFCQRHHPDSIHCLACDFCDINLDRLRAEFPRITFGHPDLDWLSQACPERCNCEKAPWLKD